MTTTIYSHKLKELLSGVCLAQIRKLYKIKKREYFDLVDELSDFSCFEVICSRHYSTESHARQAITQQTMYSLQECKIPLEELKFYSFDGTDEKYYYKMVFLADSEENLINLFKDNLHLLILI